MIIDTHTHFGEPSCPKEALYRTELPDAYKAVAIPEGVTGTVVTESSVDIEDNQWTLDQADKDPFIVGLIGHLDPFSEAFDRDLDRFAADVRFCGFRLHANCCHQYTGQPHQGVDPIPERLLKSLTRLVEKDLALDLHGGCEYFDYFAELYRRVDGLRVVINHMGECGPLTTGAPRAEWVAGIRRIASLPNAYCKVSALVQMAVQIPAPADPAFYHQVTDVVWNAFGAERLIYASNWPQIERVSDFATEHRIVACYFSEKGADAERKFFWKNAKRVYRWGRDAFSGTQLL
jgi:predicted TIM-barrel fold metal-dependent hydrolase